MTSPITEPANHELFSIMEGRGRAWEDGEEWGKENDACGRHARTITSHTIHHGARSLPVAMKIGIKTYSLGLHGAQNTPGGEAQQSGATTPGGRWEPIPNVDL